MTASLAHRGRGAAWPLLVGGAALAAGAAAARAPVPVAGAALALSALALGLLCPGVLSRGFAAALGVAVVGYAAFGRGFAYLGSPPLFVGEAVLAAGILAALLDRTRLAAFRSPVGWLLAAYAAWGALRTLPYLGEHGADALRDAALWGYSAFAVLIVPPLLRGRALERVPAAFARVLPWFLLWAPLGVFATRAWGGDLPRLPGSTVSLLAVKPGDVAVHLGGAAAFLLVGLGAAEARGWGSRARGPLLWGLWSCGFVVAASLNRGGMLAVLAAMAVAAVLTPLATARRAAALGGAALLLVVALLALDVSVDGGKGREISPRQIITNTLSVADAEGPARLDGTRAWRLAWWGKIVGYTVYGDHFWAGKGFGVNLADDDGFQVRSDGSLRSPHNAHLTLLARGGVPGLAGWVLLQGAFVLALLRGYARARRAADARFVRLFVWVLAYWAAFMVNATFDVFLEGPQGAIPFWSLFGFGVAAVLAQRAPAEAAR